jgi:hypothetical protein
VTVEYYLADDIDASEYESSYGAFLTLLEADPSYGFMVPQIREVLSDNVSNDAFANMMARTRYSRAVMRAMTYGEPSAGNLPATQIIDLVPYP